MDPPPAPSSHQPPPLAPSPHFTDHLDFKKPTIKVPIGLMPHQVAGYHRYLAELANPNSLAFKLNDLKVEDVKPSNQSIKSSASPIRAPIAQPVAMQIDSDDEEEEPVPFIKDVNVAGKSLKAANIRKFSGSSDQDAAVYYERFILSLDFIFADPSIRLPLAFQWTSGPALTALQSAMKNSLGPRTMKQMIKFMRNHFPSTISVQTLEARYEELKQKSGETVLAFWTRFQDFSADADRVGYSFNADTGFVKRLLPGVVRRHVEDEIARWDLGGNKIPIHQTLQPSPSRYEVSQQLVKRKGLCEQCLRIQPAAQ